MGSPDFTDDYTCPDCQRKGPPISDEASADEYWRGWHVTCPDCGFSIAGREKGMVLRALAVVAAWNGRVVDLMGDEKV